VPLRRPPRRRPLPPPPHAEGAEEPAQPTRETREAMRKAQTIDALRGAVARGQLRW